MCRKPCMGGCKPRPATGRFTRWLALLGLAALSASPGCVRNAMGPDGREVAMRETTFSFSVPDATYDIFKEYHLAPGDVLDVLYHVDSNALDEEFKLAVDHEVTVRFVDIPELTETQEVRPDGYISLPYLGVVRVADLSVAEVTEDLKARYRELAQQPFVIAIDHVLSVKFTDLPELNETQAVRPDGTVSLPYLGVVTAAGKTIEAFTAELKVAFARVLKSPEVYVLVSEPRTVWSEVRKKLQVPNIHVIVKKFHEVILQFKQDLHTAPRGLSRLVTIRPDGYATFALVGDMYVAGKTVPEIDTALDEKYTEVLHGLTVDLFLEKHSGSQIYVLGNVKEPGAYQILKPTPVIKALALAGSVLPNSETDDVIVFRRHGNEVVGTKIDVDAALRLEENSTFFYLQPDDIVYVPRNALSKTADVMRDIGDILFFRGWSASVRPFEDFDKKSSSSGSSSSNR